MFNVFKKEGKEIVKPIVTGKPFDSTHLRKPYFGPKPTVLLILDGWGIGPNYAGNAIALAKTPNMDMFWLTFPHTQLAASGEAVGLPKGADGNSETGHVNIGAGNIVYQDLPRVNMSIADGSYKRNQAFKNTFEHVKKNNSTLHLMGLIGTGVVHSNIQHLYALLELAKENGVKKLVIHGFTDGRDSAPTIGIEIVKAIQEKCKKLEFGILGSVTGRYFAMDRDKRWERIQTAYEGLTSGKGKKTTDLAKALQESYDAGTTDEFIEPTLLIGKDNQPYTINDDDAVIFFNFRIDRPRELTRAFVTHDFEQGIKNEDFDPFTEVYEKSSLKQKKGGKAFKREKIVKNLYFVTMTRYEEGLPVEEAFPPQPVKHPLCKIFAEQGLKQLRAAETEKEKFVTYYMNGQKEFIFPGEDRIILPSKGSKSYDLVPEMSAHEISSQIVNQIESNDHDVMIINIANPDMVGHTGNLKAGIRACEITDEVAGNIVKAVYHKNGVVMITADHGNVEEMINAKTGQIDTEHSIYPVPLIIIGKQYANQPRILPSGVLADIAPTMLSIMHLPKSPLMTGRSLI
jgi:2,3-bisphosphoglycerate-independent phosphoglycerate mutase